MKKIITSVATGIAIAVIPASQVFACHYQLSGKGDCKSDGSYEITWSFDNRGNKDAVDIDDASLSGLKNTEIHANEIVQYHQVVTNSHVNTVYHLHINGHLKSHGNGKGHDHDEDNDAFVKVDKVCQPQPKPAPKPAPQPTPQPGKGGGDVNSTTTVTPAPATQPVVQAATQVVVPKGAVNAGNGTQVTSVNPAAIAGLTASAASIGLGLRRLFKSAR